MGSRFGMDSGPEERARTAGYRVGAIANATGVTRQQLIHWPQGRIGSTPQTWLGQLGARYARLVLFPSVTTLRTNERV